MKWLIAIAVIFVASVAYGAFTLPQSNSSPNPAYSRSKSLGTKSFACVSTSYRDAVRCVTANASGTAVTTKWYFNGDNSVTYPTNEDTITTEKNKLTSVCFSAYSSATPVNASCWGW